MRYSYEFKRKCVEMYYRGEWPDTPDTINQNNFRAMIRRWVRIEESCGPEALKHKNLSRIWTPEEKYTLVAEIIAGASILGVASREGINSGLIYSWLRQYRELGYNGLVGKQRGRNTKECTMKEKQAPRPLSESEREELIRLRAEIKYIKAENAVIKKEIALREEKQAARLKAKRQQSLKNSGNKDMP